MQLTVKKKKKKKATEDILIWSKIFLENWIYLRPQIEIIIQISRTTTLWCTSRGCWDNMDQDQ